MSLQAELRQLQERESISVAEWEAILRRCQANWPEDSLPIKIGSGIRIEHAGVLAYLCLNVNNLGEALKTYIDHERRLYSITLGEITHTEDQMIITWPDFIPAMTTEVGVCSLLNFLQRLFPLHLALEGVEFAQASWTDSQADYELEFGCPVTFDNGQTRLLFNLEGLKEPPQTFQSIHQRRHAQRLAFNQILPLVDQFPRLLQQEISKALPSGQVQISHISRSIGMSTRTLQRRLDRYGLTYQQLLTGLRENLSKDYLADPSLSLSEIAMLLGYSEQSAFCRAHSQWAGITPGRLRLQLLGVIS
ncbi:AraC family transcriptional regulator ligand-binding domain-containing protein [Candidatus Pelagadaptatus aseana]|uniref:AraC family transcriptional regulator n=1 Tax=Candidatus Pelagadaptatus aseana TaxID=3120508 RepID=UPI003C6F7734